MVVAIALSPLAPIGAVRSVYPDRGHRVRLDGARPRRVAAGRRARRDRGRDRVPAGAAPSRTTFAPRRRRAGRRASARLPGLGLSSPAATGVRFALEPGRGRNAVPVRSAILGAALAIVVVVSTITFGASLHTLVSRPALYGWNWDYELSGRRRRRQRPAAAGREGARPRPRRRGLVGRVLRRGASRRAVAFRRSAASTNADVGPPLLSGHALDAPGQIVLGASTLAQLHKHIGDTVAVNTGEKHPVELQIVGTATMPAIGGSGGGSLHLEMGTRRPLPVPGHPTVAARRRRQQTHGPERDLRAPATRTRTDPRHSEA